MFTEMLKKELNSEIQLTENGAKGYRTAGDALVDLNFRIPSYRTEIDVKVIDDFIKAFSSDPVNTIKYLFFARDAREGLGERRFFKICFNWFCKNNPEAAKELVPLVAKYGRFDDLFCAYDTPVKQTIVDVLKAQLAEDLANYASNKPISLLAKWLPSVNTSSNATRKLARDIYPRLGFVSEKKYRKTLSALRKYLDVTEVKISANDWELVDYEKVASKANLLYNNAFLKHDEERRRKYLSRLQKGEAKINASVAYPYDIVHKYMQSGYYHSYVKSFDATLEAMWKALPNTVKEDNSTIVVADGSDSMTCNIGNTSVTALDVANSLAIYFAEKLQGEYANKYITFSSRPQFVDFSHCKSLKEKIETALAFCEVSNTDIEKVFRLILNTAINNKLKQEELPKNILIISDMEFDHGTNRIGKTLFDSIKKEYELAGYKLPRLVFWNVNSRTNTVPLHQNDLGVTLVSGFSVNICKMVLSDELDPYKCLINQLSSERYEPVDRVIRKFY